MNFYPAWGAGDVLTVILCTPPLHKTHADGTHFRQFVHGLESMVNRLTKESCEFLVVEDLKAASRWNFTDCGGMKAMMVVTVTTLYENAAVAQTLGKDLTSNVIQMYTFTDMTSGILNGGVSIDVREQS